MIVDSVWSITKLKTSLLFLMNPFHTRNAKLYLIFTDIAGHFCKSSPILSQIFFDTYYRVFQIKDLPDIFAEPFSQRICREVWGEKNCFSPWKVFILNTVISLQVIWNPVGTAWSNDVETTLFRLHKRLYNVVSTSFDHGVSAGKYLHTYHLPSPSVVE